MDGSDHLLHLPTLHVHGLKDPGIANHRRLLADFCLPGTTHLVEWDGGHRIAIRAADVAVIAKEILALCNIVNTNIFRLYLFLLVYNTVSNTWVYQANRMTILSTELFLCGPQARLPLPQELEQLRQVLLGRESFCVSLTVTLKDLPNILQQLTAFDSTLKSPRLHPSTSFCNG